MELSRVGLPLKFLILPLLYAQDECDAVPASWSPGAQGFQFCKALKHMLSTRTSTSSTCSRSLDLTEISTRPESWKGLRRLCSAWL